MTMLGPWRLADHWALSLSGVLDTSPVFLVDGERRAPCVRLRPSRLASSWISMSSLAAFKEGHGLAEMSGVHRGSAFRRFRSPIPEHSDHLG